MEKQNNYETIGKDVLLEQIRTTTDEAVGKFLKGDISEQGVIDTLVRQTDASLNTLNGEPDKKLFDGWLGEVGEVCGNLLKQLQQGAINKEEFMDLVMEKPEAA